MQWNVTVTGDNLRPFVLQMVEAADQAAAEAIGIAKVPDTDNPSASAVKAHHDDPDQAIAIQWSRANEKAVAGVDHNSREKYIDWKYDPAIAQTAKDRIADVNGWLDAIWQAYYVAKDAIGGGNLDAQFEYAPDCPWTFAQIKEVI